MSINPGHDPVDILCNKMKHIPPTELQQARKLLTEYRDLFYISDQRIGRTNLTEFHVYIDSLDPVPVPLRRVPIHHRDIIQILINQYESLGLIEAIDSPLRTSTASVAKKEKCFQ